MNDLVYVAAAALLFWVALMVFAHRRKARTEVADTGQLTRPEKPDEPPTMDLDKVRRWSQTL